MRVKQSTRVCGSKTIDNRKVLLLSASATLKTKLTWRPDTFAVEMPTTSLERTSIRSPAEMLGGMLGLVSRGLVPPSGFYET